MSQDPASRTRRALTTVVAAWAVETLLSLAMSVALSQPASGRRDAIVAGLAAVSALFVPVSLALSLASLRLARASGARWTGSAAALLFGAHSLLIVVQMLAPVLFGSLGREAFGELQRLVGGSLTGVRYLGWAALAMALQTAAGRAPRGQGLFTVAFAAGVGVAVVNVFFPRTDATWVTLTQATNLLANGSFLVLAISARNLVPRGAEAPVPAPRKLGAISIVTRGIATFVVVMLGGMAGGAGVVVATSVVPVVSALFGIGFVAALVWESRSISHRSAALKIALALATLSMAADVGTSAQLLRALTGASKGTGLAVGGIGWIAGLAASIGWVGVMRREAGARGPATWLLALGAVYGALVTIAWAKDSQTTGTIALLALTAWGGLAYSMAVATLAWRPGSDAPLSADATRNA